MLWQVQLSIPAHFLLIEPYAFHFVAFAGAVSACEGGASLWSSRIRRYW